MAKIMKMSKTSKCFKTKLTKTSKCFEPEMTKISKCLDNDVNKKLPRPSWDDDCGSIVSKYGSAVS